MLFAFRRGVFVLLALLLLPPHADAGLWDDLWLRADQQAYRLLQEGQPEFAAARFEDVDWRAIALYRSGEYERAAAAFAAAAERPANAGQGAGRDPLTARFNLGNALARAGDYQGAIDRYDEVLAREPGHEDARFNRALMEKLLAERQAAEQAGAQDQGARAGAPRDTEPQAANEANQDSRSTGQAQAADGRPPADGRPSDQDAEQSAATREGDETESERELAERAAERDALEQWLRRVPDDPGGLLRRKFQYETNERMRRGEYRASDPEKIW
jgi:Ca-activated chloride channel family protein